ncbi:hypothetical protein Tco_0619839, partial [Tanacetum coccineum]
DDVEEDEDEGEEEEEHLASVDSVSPLVYRVMARMSIQPQTLVPFPSKEEVDRLLDISTRSPSPLTPLSLPLPHIPSPPLPVSPTHSLGYRAAMIRLRAKSPSTSYPLPLPLPIVLPHTMVSMAMMRAATPSTYILAPPSGTPPLLHIPLSTSPPPLLLPSTDCRVNVLEVTLPPRKRLYIALGLRFEVGKSSSAPTARPTEGFRADYGFVSTLDDEIRRVPERDVGYMINNNWDDTVEEMQGTSVATDVTSLSQRMSDFVTTVRHDTDEIYRRLDDAQDDRVLMSSQLNMLPLRTIVLAQQVEIKALRIANYTRQTQLVEAVTPPNFTAAEDWIRDEDLFIGTLQTCLKVHLIKSEVVHSVFNSRESDVDDSPVNDRFKTGEGFHAVPPPYTGNYMPSRPDLSFAGLDDSVYKTKVSETETSISKTSKDIVEKPKTVRPSAPIIEEWDTDSDNDSVFRPKSDQTKPKFTKINFVKSDENVKSVNKENTHRQVEYPRKSQSPRDNRRNWNGMMTQKLGNGFESIKKACFVCGSFNHLIKDCDFHENKMVEKPVLNKKGRFTDQREIRPVWNNALRVNHQNKLTHPHPKRKFVPTAVLTKSGQVPVNAVKQSSPRAAASISTARPVNTAAPKSKVNDALPTTYSYFKAHSPGNPQYTLQDQGIFDSGCSRHMTGNKSFLTDYQEIDGGFVAFGGSPKRGKITGKGIYHLTWKLFLIVIMLELALTGNPQHEVLWIQNQMLDYGFNFMNTKIYIDNESTIYIVKNPVFHSKTKHIEIRYHFIRDSYEKRLIQVIKIHTDHNVADLFTKAFDVSSFKVNAARQAKHIKYMVFNASPLNQTPRQAKRGRDTKIPQSGGPPEKIGDEAVHKELGDRMERVATTASNLEAEQNSGNINRTQSMATLNEPSP